MFKAIDKWMPGYLASVMRRPKVPVGLKHLMFCVADHFEPFRQEEDAERRAQSAGRKTGRNEIQSPVFSASLSVACDRVREWVKAYPQSVDGFRDADGRTPRHTFFYPQEEYDESCVETLAALCRAGHGEVEIQLHHRNDTPEGFRQKLADFRDKLRNNHGLLGSWHSAERMAHGAQKDGERCSSGVLRRSSDSVEVGTKTGTMLSAPCAPHLPAFGFVHGNWSLCNSRPDGDWCGVNEELGILSAAGCYADFTFPSAPSPTQPRMVNAIYRAVDNPGAPRGCDRGVRSRAQSAERKEQGEKNNQERSSSGSMLASATCPAVAPWRRRKCPHEDGRHAPCAMPPSPLLLITGPLGLDWNRRKWGILPRLENGDITGANPPTPARVDSWVRHHIHVEGNPEWVFVKVYTHGCHAANMDTVLGAAMQRAHKYLCSRYNDGKEWNLHYVTAREMYNIVRAAEDGMMGNPGEFRDYEVRREGSASA